MLSRAAMTLSTLLFLPVLTHAAEIGAGLSTPARKRAALARDLVEHAIYTCLVQAEDCKAEPAERELLLKILNAMPNETAPIEFKSAAQNPGMFDVAAGSHRFAVTGETANATIYINTDELDPLGTGANLATIISILTHEFGHHQGVHDSEDHALDLLGNKVAHVFTQNLQRVQGATPTHAQFEVLVYNQIAGPGYVSDWTDQNLGTFPMIYVSDGERIVSISESYPFLLNCPYGTEVRHAWLTGLRWKDDNTLAAQEEHRCLSSGKGLTVKETYFAGLEPSVGSDGRLRLGETPAQQAIEISPLELESDISYVNLLGMTAPTLVLEASSETSKPAQLDHGGTWKVSVEVKGDAKAFSSCSLLIGSDEFQLAYASGQKYAFESDEKTCKIVPLSGHRFRVEASHDFDAKTERRKYFLRAVKLMPKPITSSAGAVFPTVRQEVSVGTAPAQIHTISSLTLSSEGKSMQSPALGFVPNQLCKYFQITVELPGGADIQQAHLKYTQKYRHDEFTPITQVERISLNALYNWKMDSRTTATGGRSVTFTIYLFPEFMEVDKIGRIEFRELTIETKAMEEYRASFPPATLGLDSYYPIGGTCDH